MIVLSNSQGAEILANDYKNFPPKLPILFVHGTDDRVTYCQATESLVKKIKGDDVTFKVSTASRRWTSTML